MSKSNNYRIRISNGVPMSTAVGFRKTKITKHIGVAGFSSVHLFGRDEIAFVAPTRAALIRFLRDEMAGKIGPWSEKNFQRIAITPRKAGK